MFLFKWWVIVMFIKSLHKMTCQEGFLYDTIKLLNDEFRNNQNFEKYILNDTQCYESLFRNKNIQIYLQDMLLFSAREFDDIGEYKECVQHQHLYIFLRLVKFSMTGDSPQRSMYGFCVPTECRNFFTHTLDPLNRDFHQVLFKEHQFKILYDESFIHTNEERDTQKRYAFSTGGSFLLILIGLYTFLRVFYVIYSYCQFGRHDFAQYDRGEYEINKIKSRRKQLISDKSRKVKIEYQIYSILSFGKALKYTISLKNKIYNDEGLEKVLMIKVLILFFINSFTMFSVYLRDYYTAVFSNLISPLKKLAYYSPYAYMVISGLTYSYKFFNYLHAKKDFNLSQSFLKFYTISFTRLIVYMTIMLNLYYFSLDVFKYFGDFFYLEARDYGTTSITEFCQEGIWKFFVPFLTNYTDNHGKSNLCPIIYDILSSEFFIFTFFHIFLYIAFKLKSRFFEAIIFLIQILLLILKLAEFKNDSNVYDIHHAYYNIKQITMPHDLLFPYSIGIFTGIFYFYNNNATVFIENRYIPYTFLFSIPKFLYKLSYRLSALIIYFIIFLIIALSSNYLLLKLMYEETIPHTTFVYFIELYEHFIFSLLFGLFMIFFTFINTKTRSELKFKNLILVRSSYHIIMYSHTMSALVKLNTADSYGKETFLSDIWVLTGAFIFTVNLAITSNFLFEIPIRILYKKFIAKKLFKE
jgi:hypothetical protein